MEIKLLTPSDAQQYRILRLEGLKDNPEAFSASFEEENEFNLDIYQNRLSSDTTQTFGAFEGNNLIGVVTLIKEQKRKLKHRVSIVAMYVTSKHRKKSVGVKLMTAAIAAAKKDTAIQQIYLSVTATNVPAKNLYTALGFESYGVDKRALKVEDQYFDEELMVLFL